VAGGDFILKIRNAAQTEPIYHMTPVLGEIEDINDYLK